MYPRFSGEARDENKKLVMAMDHIASEKGVTLAQLSLAWVLAKGEDIVPIPGTKRRKWLRENVGALEVVLSNDEVTALEAAVPREKVVGDRYSALSATTLNG